MSKGEDTRRAIVTQALELAGTVGLETLTLGTLAEQLKLSKSGLFAHFKSKEVLQLAVLDEAIARFTTQVLEKALAEPRGAPRVHALARHYMAWIQNPKTSGGCIFIALTQEYDARPGPIRDRLVESQRSFRDLVGRLGASAATTRGTFDAGQFAFEFLGIALSLQEAHTLFRDHGAARHALVAFNALYNRFGIRQEAS